MMRAWLTKEDSLSLQVRGLGRVTMWFTKPTFFEGQEWVMNDHDDFKNGWWRHRWEAHGSKGNCFCSCEFLIGSQLGQHIWNLVVDSENPVEDFRKWDSMKPKVSWKDWCAEIELDMSLVNVVKVYIDPRSSQTRTVNAHEDS